MANPTLTNTFSSGTTAIASQWNSNFTDIVNGLSDGTKDSRINNLAAAGTLNVTGDLYSTVWTDYSSTSTIVGFSSYTVKKIYYKKIGSTVLCWYHLYGTGNSDSMTFTLPFQADTDYGVIGFSDNMDDTIGTSVGRIVPLANNIFDVSLDFLSTAWTTGVLHRARGCFSFEISS